MLLSHFFAIFQLRIQGLDSIDFSTDQRLLLEGRRKYNHFKIFWHLTSISCLFLFVFLLFILFQSPQPPQYIYWQRNDRMVNYDDNRRDISIDTIPGPRTQSRLTIREPQISDSGNYTCRASNTEPASIYVYVSKGKFLLIILGDKNQKTIFFCDIFSVIKVRHFPFNSLFS